jgi:signal transduction histidine kinase
MLAAGAVLSVLLSRSTGAELTGPRPAVAEEVGWCLAVTLPLAVRRWRPLPVLIVVALAFIGLQARGVGEGLVSQIALFLAFFTAGAWSRDRPASAATRGLVVSVMFCWLAYALASTTWDEVRDRATHGPLPAVVATAVLAAIVNVLYFGAAWAFGDMYWRSAGQRALLEQRAGDLARERDENARRAVLDERVRIARELHDVVAHHVSVIGVQAGAARVVLEHDPSAARAPLLAVERESREAVQEMRRLLGVLRDRSGESEGESTGEGDGLGGPAGDPPPPVPGVEGIGDLVEGTGAVGVLARYTVVGAPVPLSPSLSVSIYRIVQEALTNTLRHAGAARVDVRLRYLEPPGVEVEVVDDGPGRGPAGHGGLGLVGMRERTGLHGGELEVGPRPAGGFRVRARFPLVEAGR